MCSKDAYCPYCKNVINKDILIEHFSECSLIYLHKMSIIDKKKKEYKIKPTGSIQVRPFTHANIDYLDDSLILEFIHEPDRYVDKLIKQIYFNIYHPENHNIIQKGERYKLFDGYGEFNDLNQNNVMFELIKNVVEYAKQFLDKSKQEHIDTLKQSLDTFLMKHGKSRILHSRIVNDLNAHQNIIRDNAMTEKIIYIF